LAKLHARGRDTVPRSYTTYHTAAPARCWTDATVRPPRYTTTNDTATNDTTTNDTATNDTATNDTSTDTATDPRRCQRRVGRSGSARIGNVGK
jgi:hypothetical protein